MTTQTYKTNPAEVQIGDKHKASEVGKPLKCIHLQLEASSREAEVGLTQVGANSWKHDS